MQISYEKKMAPIEAGCCFLPFQSHPQMLMPTSPKVFRSTNQMNKTSVSESEKLLKERKQGIQSMKKSISSINLKRKNSDGQPTNRVSLNQSQFLFKPQKRFVTQSMDSEALRQFFPHYQSSNNFNSGFNQFSFENKKNQYLPSINETLDSLADKFKKNREIQIQNYVQQTKKHTYNPNINQTLLQNQNLEKTSSKQFSNYQNYSQNNIQTLMRNQTVNRINFKSPQRQHKLIQNPQKAENIKFRQSNQITGNHVHNNHFKMQMNQVDSMIIQVNGPKSLQLYDKKSFLKKESGHLGIHKEVSESKHFDVSNIVKTRKKGMHAEKNLANYNSQTVNSDYEQDEHERVQKIQESAIMMNFFNPPSFIKDNLDLSGVKKF